MNAHLEGLEGSSPTQNMLIPEDVFLHPRDVVGRNSPATCWVPRRHLAD